MNDLFMEAEWRKLFIANYIVDRQMLQQFVPAKTELDDWDGNHFVSLVAFMFVNTRIKKIAVPFHRNFEEVNLRFYVRYKDGNDWKRGVVFIREFVSLPMVTISANALYGENYRTVRTAHRWEIDPQKLNVEYRWKKKRWHTVSAELENKPELIITGSKENFVTQHFWGYTKRSDHTLEYHVDHPLWKLYPMVKYNIDVSFKDCYGSHFEPLDRVEPESVFFVEGSDVRIFSGRKI